MLSGISQVWLSNDDPYIVEKILEKRFLQQGNQYEYLVQWVGYHQSVVIPHWPHVAVVFQYRYHDTANNFVGSHIPGN